MIPSLYAHTIDSLKHIDINEVEVVGNGQLIQQRISTLSIEVVGKDDITKHFSGNVIKSLEHIPGVQSMSVGSGFSKPMIRGMGFNRVSVVDKGIKQEGQQWGADHGLEIDAFGVERINVRKGSSSLLFGSDAMGGVIEILPPTIPTSNSLFGEVDLLAGSVNGLFGGSIMLGIKQNRLFVKARYSEQHFADFAVPTKQVVYLTQLMPITNGRVNNSAGFERDYSLYARYGGDKFSSALLISNAFQKTGFYPGAHGVPDPSRVYDDGSIWDIDLPYNKVNHFKVSSLNKIWWNGGWISCDLAYQKNNREEWSLFHTHYTTQKAPDLNPNLEIALFLQNYSSDIKLHLGHTSIFSSEAALSVAYQDNRIGGYSFLIPEYNRLTFGGAWVANLRMSNYFRLSGGVRYDFGKIAVSEYKDIYLADYLTDSGYSQSIVDSNKTRSYGLNRNFGDYSLSLGMVWNISPTNILRVNMGRSFRLPNANELVANGVHHSSFCHEQGTPTLNSERGWQLDLGYEFVNNKFTLSISPYISWYSSYIYLQPTLEWSILPHAGQIYKFSQIRAFFAGSEVEASVVIAKGWSYELSGEYSYSYNLDQQIPITFTPPTTLRNQISWEKGIFTISGEWKFVAKQNHVARNEESTPGVNLFGLRAVVSMPFISDGATMVAAVDNIFNSKYLNHLSYYRHVEIPEPGRNFQLSIKIPFNFNKNEN